MDRKIIYPGAIPLENDLLETNRFTMIGLAKLASAVMGTTTYLHGLACVPTSPASMAVTVAAGEIYSLQNVDSAAYSSLQADTAHSILKQGVMMDAMTLPVQAPTTNGFSQNYLIQVAFEESDTENTVLPYYNASNPTQAWHGPNNSGTAQGTVRSGKCVIKAKAGIAATTGTQTTPGPDAGYVGAYVVAVAAGQTTISAANITFADGAPFLPAGGLVEGIQTGAMNYALDHGRANTYAASFTPPVKSLVDGMKLIFRATNANTGASTFSPDSLPAAPIYSNTSVALTGGEILAQSQVEVSWNSALNAWVLVNTNLAALSKGFVKSVDGNKPDPKTGDVDTRRGDTTQPVIALPRILDGNNAYIKIATIRDCGTNSSFFQVTVYGTGGYGSPGQNVEEIAVSCRGITNMTAANANTYIQHEGTSRSVSSVLRVVVAPTATAGQFDIHLNAPAGWWSGANMRVDTLENGGGAFITGPVADRKMGATTWVATRPADSFLVNRRIGFLRGDYGIGLSIAPTTKNLDFNAYPFSAGESLFVDMASALNVPTGLGFTSYMIIQCLGVRDNSGDCVLYCASYNSAQSAKAWRVTPTSGPRVWKVSKDASATDLGNYLPLAGGTLTGDLIIAKTSAVAHLRSSGGNSVLFFENADGTERAAIYSGVNTDTGGELHFRVKNAQGGTSGDMVLKSDGSLTTPGDLATNKSLYAKNGANIDGEMNSLMDRSAQAPNGSFQNGGLIRSFIKGRGALADPRGAYASMYAQECVGSYHQIVLNLNGYGMDMSWTFKNDGTFWTPTRVGVGNAHLEADGNIWGTRWNPNGAWLWDSVVGLVNDRISPLSTPDAVGSLAILCHDTALGLNATAPGSALFYSGFGAQKDSYGDHATVSRLTSPQPSGTWRCLGVVPAPNNNDRGAALFCRIA